MNIPDLINGIFEGVMGGFATLNVFTLLRDKTVRGVHWLPFSWAALWGIWNLYYYPHLNQWFSFTGGLFIVSTNLTWLALVCYYAASKGKSQ